MFKFVKENLTPTEVVRGYLGEPNRLGFYKSPFREERTASLRVDDKRGIFDFGSAKHYDIIDFAAEYFKCSGLEACKILIKDFNLNYEKDTKVDSKYIERKKKEKEKKEEIEWFYDFIYHNLTKKLKKIRSILCSLKGKRISKKAYNKILNDYKEVNILVDNIMYATKEEKEIIYELQEFYMSKI